MVLGVLFVGINAVLAASDLVRPETRPLVVSISQLLFAYALIHFVVLVLVNPLREDRVPDYFPTIVQDVLVFVLFAMVATLVMEEKFLTTSAVGAVVAGLALQDTLGNLVSGPGDPGREAVPCRALDQLGQLGRRGRRDHLARDQAAHAARQPGDRAQRRAGQGGDHQLLGAGLADAHRGRSRHRATTTRRTP